MYLYRAIDTTGQVPDFLLNETRCTRAAKRFFCKGLGGSKRVGPRVINVDQNDANIGPVRDLKEAGLLPDNCERRPVKYLTNIVEQDHRFIKRRIKPGLGFDSYPTAWHTIQGYEVMHMIKMDKSKTLNKEIVKHNISSSTDCLD